MSVPRHVYVTRGISSTSGFFMPSFQFTFMFSYSFHVIIICVNIVLFQYDFCLLLIVMRRKEIDSS
uniref:Uncharacterized protein n=1 Tax=Arundo donax TaxID=35708 RepID=A0A0A8Z989_ARUDO